MRDIAHLWEFWFVFLFFVIFLLLGVWVLHVCVWGGGGGEMLNLHVSNVVMIYS